MKRCLPPLFAAASLSLGQAVAQTATSLPPSTLTEPAARQSSSQLYGRIEGDTYVSATGYFKVRIPVLAELGGAITDTPNIVTFDDDFSVHTSVGAIPLTPELRAEYEARGAKEFLVHFFTTLVMPDFVARFPGAHTEESATFLPKYQDGALLIPLLLPGGSFFEHRVRVGPFRAPAVAKRGNLCFVKNGCFFVVSTELAERVLERSTYTKTPQEENAILRQRLTDLVDKMVFLTPPPEPKN